MLDLIDRPDLFLEAGNIIVQNAITFAVAQVKAGADMLVRNLDDQNAYQIAVNSGQSLRFPIAKYSLSNESEAII